MYSEAFDYLAPTTLDEALAMLAEHGADAKILAGGQSLLPMMKLRLARPPLLIDLNRIPDLSYIAEDDEYLRVGAMTRHAELAASDLLRERYPLMASAAPQIADPLVRNLGTIGGSLAHADPAGDWESVMLALEADVVARSASGERVIPVTELLQGMFTTALEPDEILTEIRVPRPKRPVGGAYLKLERKVGDYATVAAAVQLELDDAGTIARAGIALTAVGAQNIKATAAEATLRGQTPSPELFGQAAQLAADASDPSEDVRGSEAYKRDMVRVLVRRGLQAALAMMQQPMEA